MKRVYIIHSAWKDFLYLDFTKNTFYRESDSTETGTFVKDKDKNILHIFWDKWDDELFILNKNDNTYYKCVEMNFIHEEWEDLCYIDEINEVGYYTGDNDEIHVSWENDIGDIIDNDDNIINVVDHKIPNIIHFIYGLKIQDEDFDLYKYLAIKSAHDVNNPDKIYFYYKYEPKGYWWEKIKPLLILEHIDPPTEIYGNKVYHYAHQTDIIRLQKLIEHGGIYLDIDTICLKPFTDLLNNVFVMGQQNNCDGTQIYGLCNAVLLCEKDSSFAIKWLETYKNFRSLGRDQYWDEHSVINPLKMSSEYPNDIKILGTDSFFYPLWYDINKILFSTDIDINEYKKIIGNNYCIHLWDTYSNSYLKTLNENTIFSVNTLYNIFSRKFLRNKISIVFLTYNRTDHTKKCLNSYLKCLESDDIKELIIFDNNSERDLTDFLLEYKDNNRKIKVIFNDENIGVCHGRIVLFKEAVGDIIVSLDSDAYLLDESFFDRIKKLLYSEELGIVGISGAYIKSWDFGTQQDIPNEDTNEYYVDHIAGCCQTFRRDLFHFGFELDNFYGKFWVEDTDLSMQSLYMNKKNFRISQNNYIEHNWGGSGKNYKDLFVKNWEYFCKKWNKKIILK